MGFSPRQKLKKLLVIRTKNKRSYYFFLGIIIVLQYSYIILKLSFFRDSGNSPTAGQQSIQKAASLHWLPRRDGELNAKNLGLSKSGKIQFRGQESTFLDDPYNAADVEMANIKLGSKERNRGKLLDSSIEYRVKNAKLQRLRSRKSRESFQSKRHVQKSKIPLEQGNSIWSPVQYPPRESTCERWLTTEDEIPSSRDFHSDPISVTYSEDRTWKDCAVGCRHVAGYNNNSDAQLGVITSGGSIRVHRSMESRSYFEENVYNTAKRMGYQVVMTVHLDSDVPVGYFSWEEYDIMADIPEKDPSLNGSAVAFISNCDARSFRMEAVKQLQKFLPVDSYGSCLNNKPWQSKKMEVIKKYKVCLAFENSIEEDYVTEKFFQSLVAGCVPVVIGAPNIAQFAPSPASFIHYKSLSETKNVVNAIKRLVSDESMFNLAMEWKKVGPTDSFKALMDMATVHSSCRLCIFLADRVREKELLGSQKVRPCRCKSEVGLVTYHFFVRERGRFHYSSIFLSERELELDSLKEKIELSFEEREYVPVWHNKRPKVLQTSTVTLKVFRIYPSNSNQREAIFGRSWFRSSEQFQEFLLGHPCPRLEVIFV